jgi:hemoglobin
MQPMRRLLAGPVCASLVCLLAAVSTPSSVHAGTDLYDQLGGSAGVAAIIDRFAVLVTTDDRTKADFDNINMEWLKPRLRDYVCQIAGGPCHYKGRSMATAHEGLDLNQAKFNAVAEDIQTAMEQVGISFWTQNRLLARLAPLQRDIVRR